MESIPVLTSGQRAAWLTRNHAEYYEFIAWEANRIAHGKSATVEEWRQALVDAKLTDVPPGTWFERLGRRLRP